MAFLDDIHWLSLLFIDFAVSGIQNHIQKQEDSMKKGIAIFIAAVLFCTSAFAAGGGYLSVGLGPEAILKVYNTTSGNVTETDAGAYSTMGGSLDVSIGYEFGGAFGLGLRTGVDYNGSKLPQYAGIITVPVMLEAVIAPSFGGGARIPVTLAAGGHAQFIGNKVALGAAAAASVGFMADVSESLSIGYEVGAEVLMQFAKGFGSATYQVNLMPITLEMTCRF